MLPDRIREAPVPSHAAATRATTATVTDSTLQSSRRGADLLQMASTATLG
jgi:hypothetical protein